MIGQRVQKRGGMSVKYEYWLACIRPLAGGKKERLRSCAGSGEAVYNM